MAPLDLALKRLGRRAAPAPARTSEAIEDVAKGSRQPPLLDAAPA
jgi:hypothetical protein